MFKTFVSMSLTSLVFLAASAASAYPNCTVSQTTGSVCEIEISDLVPTQFALGQLEVKSRAKKFKGMSSNELAKYVSENLAPVIISPSGEFYQTDKHHMAAALQSAQGTHFKILASIVKNWHSIDMATFWSNMEANHFVYLFDENGEGPKSVDDLPRSIADMKNDPYRSLAWGVRKGGGYDETTILYADFQWANFLRTRVSFDDQQDDFSEAVKQGMKWAHDKEALGLPGYNGH